MSEIKIKDDREGMGAVRWLLGIIAAIVLGIMFSGGCATSAPTERYPFPIMLDPVTEATPDVKVK